MITSDRKYLNEYLNDGVATVCFTKLNGEQRVMHCTLNEDWIPTEKMPKNAQPMETNAEVRTAFDIDVGGWRSFRYDTVEWFMEGVEEEEAA